MPKANKHKQQQAQPKSPPKAEINQEELMNECLVVYELLKDRTKALREMAGNDFCYVLSTKWLKQWKEYVGYEQLVGEEQQNKNKKDKMIGKRHPGKINNDIIASKTQANQFYTIPKELQEYQYLSQIINEKKTKDDEYIAITPNIWLQLLKYYEGIPIKRPIKKIKNTFYYDGSLINFDVIFANVESEDIEQQLKTANKKNFTSIFKSDKIIASNFWTLEQLQHFLSEYCRVVYNHSKIRIWKGQSYIATNPLNEELVKSLKDRSLLVKARLLEKSRYKDAQLQDFLKTTHTLIVQMGSILKPNTNKDNDLFGYCEECVVKKKLLISCLCGQIHYCSEKCRIQDQQFHHNTCQMAYDSEDDEQFQKKIIETVPLAGLDNLANTCYMNSILQALISINSIRTFFTTNQYLQFLDQKQNSENKCRFLKKFSKTIKNLQGEESYTPWPLKSQIDYNLAPFKGDKQHDANDFLINYLNCINDHLTKEDNKAFNKILQPFIGEFYSKVLCPHCNVKSENNEIFIQISLPLKAKPSQKVFHYVVVESYVQVKRGKCNASDTWKEIKQSLGAPQSTIYVGKQAVLSHKVNEEEDDPQKVLRSLKGELFFYKGMSIAQGETQFPFGLITQKIICGSKMKSPYGVPILIAVRDKQITVGTFWLQIIKFFCAKKEEIVKQAEMMEIEYYSQIQSQIKEDDKVKEKNEENVTEKTENGQEKASPECEKIVKQYNNKLKMFAERIGIEVFVNDLKKSRNVCKFCKKKCNGCFLPKEFDIAFEDFFESKYLQVRFQVFLSETVEIEYQQNDFLIIGDPTIHDCIQLFSQPEQLDQQNAWYCSNCDSMALALKQLHIKTYPDTLIIHLNRFKTVNGKKMKNNDPILYSEIQIFDGRDYRLIGAVIHEGSMEGGHYWSIVLREGRYYIFNDSKVTQIQKVFNKNAYILIYQRF